jgi:transcriptional regulator with XRE-family HTH domain
MNISKMENKYTTKQIAEILGVTDKSVRRYLNSYFSINNGAYEVSEKMLNILKTEYLGQPTDNLRTGEEPQEPLKGNEDFENGRIEFFTEDEYQEFHKRLSEYPYLKERVNDILNELDYHKRTGESHNKQMEIILQTLQQRNYIEAKEKKLDK